MAAEADKRESGEVSVYGSVEAAGCYCCGVHYPFFEDHGFERSS